MSNLNNELFDWDSEIESDGAEYVSVQPGDYTFTVTDVERKQYNGSDKMPACNMVTVSGEIDVPNGIATFRENLYLIKRNEWKLSSFFRCLGMKKHGEKLRMNFNGAVGKRGMAAFKTREYNDKVYNCIDHYYDYDPEKMNQFTEVKDENVPW